MSETAFVSIGSNLDPRANVARALAALRESFGELRLSNSYECAAVGFDGPPFLNLVVGFETDLSPGEVVAQLHAIDEMPRSHIGKLLKTDLRAEAERRGLPG